MTDLQCPARVLVARHGARTPDVAAVYTWSAADVGDVRASLDAIADRHRGESVLVLVSEPERAAVLAWAGSLGNAADDDALVLEGDASGWRVVR